MHQRMMAATGANPSETWMRKMIAHHRGGVAMSNVLFDLGGDPQILEKARMPARDQDRETEDLQRMMQGDVTTAQPTAEVQPATEPSEHRKEQQETTQGKKEKENTVHKARNKKTTEAATQPAHNQGK